MAQDNVRWVCHYHAPSTLSEYVQEIGRGGRDGEPANALTLVSEPTGWLDPEDKQRWRFFSESGRQLQQEAGRLVKRLPQRGHIDRVVDPLTPGQPRHWRCSTPRVGCGGKTRLSIG